MTNVNKSVCYVKKPEAKLLTSLTHKYCLRDSFSNAYLSIRES